MEKFVKISQVAKKFGVSERTVRRWIRKKKIRAVILKTGQYRISKTEADEFYRQYIPK